MGNLCSKKEFKGQGHTLGSADPTPTPAARPAKQTSYGTSHKTPNGQGRTLTGNAASSSKPGNPGEAAARAAEVRDSSVLEGVDPDKAGEKDGRAFRDDIASPGAEPHRATPKFPVPFKGKGRFGAWTAGVGF
jgi:hypothetical protein